MTANSRVNLYVRKNGTDYYLIGSSLDNYTAAGAVVLPMNGSTDYVEICMTHQLGSDQTVDGTAGNTYFQGQWIGP